MIDKILKLFSRKENQEKEENQEIPESDLLLNEFIKSKKYINQINSNYDDLVLKSLEEDFDDYKSTIDGNNDIDCWKIDGRAQFDEFPLIKKSSNGILRLQIKYSFHEYTDYKFKIDNIYLSPGTISLDREKLNDIIKKYILYYKVKHVKVEEKNIKENYDKVISVIGKDIRRDAILDKLLNGK